MKTKLEKCNVCGEITLHDVGKKQATSNRGAYSRRTTKRCRQCGTREINNSHQGKRTIKGNNQLPK